MIDDYNLVLSAIEIPELREFMRSASEEDIISFSFALTCTLRHKNLWQYADELNRIGISPDLELVAYSITHPECTCLIAVVEGRIPDQPGANWPTGKVIDFTLPNRLQFGAKASARPSMPIYAAYRMRLTARIKCYFIDEPVP